jgi:hypothetical protein
LPPSSPPSRYSTPLGTLATYAAAGLIAWDPALVLALATTLGGYIVAQYARRIRHMGLLRSVIIGIGAVMRVVFFTT